MLRVRPPSDRVSVLTRLGLAVSCGAVAVQPWLIGEATNGERVHASFAILAGALLLVSVLVPRHLPALVIDPAATLAAIVLLYHGILVCLSGEYDGPGIAHEALFGIGAGIVAIALMLSLTDQPRYGRRGR